VLISTRLHGQIPEDSNLYEERPKLAVEWLTLLFRILEILDSNLGLETGYLD
jgi:hypothetical protein